MFDISLNSWKELQLIVEVRYQKNLDALMNFLPPFFSFSSMENHRIWVKDVEAYNERVSGQTKRLNYPIIADPERDLAIRFG